MHSSPRQAAGDSAKDLLISEALLRRVKVVKRNISVIHWYWKKAVISIRYEGFPFLVWHILKFCLRPLGHLGNATFYQIDLTQPIPEIPAKVDLTIGPAVESDVDQLVNLVAQRFGPAKDLQRYTRLGIRETITERFQRGCKCFVGKIGTRIVSYNWIFFGWEESFHGSGCFIHLKKDEALMDEAFTLEELRGKAIHVALHTQMLLFLKRAGYQRSYTISGSPRSPTNVFKYVPWKVTGAMLHFIPRGGEKAWKWRTKGTLEPFVSKQAPVSET